PASVVAIPRTQKRRKAPDGLAKFMVTPWRVWTAQLRTEDPGLLRIGISPAPITLVLMGNPCKILFLLRRHGHAERSAIGFHGGRKIDAHHLLIRLRVLPGHEVQANLVIHALGKLILPLPGHLGARRLRPIFLVPPVENVLAPDDRDRHRVAVVPLHGVFSDNRVRGSLKGKARGMKDVQLRELLVYLDPFHFFRLVREALAAQLNAAFADLEFHAGQSLLARGQRAKAVGSVRTLVMEILLELLVCLGLEIKKDPFLVRGFFPRVLLVICPNQGCAQSAAYAGCHYETLHDECLLAGIGPRLAKRLGERRMHAARQTDSHPAQEWSGSSPRAVGLVMHFQLS